MSMRSDASLAPRPPEEMREQCRLCNAPATVELFTGYWLSAVLCQPRARGQEAQPGLIRTRCWQRGWQSFVGPWRPHPTHIAEYFFANTKKSFAGVRHRTSKSVRLVTVVN
jgi:hypothetical protein